MTSLRYRLAIVLMLLLTVTGFSQLKYSVSQTSSTFALLTGASSFTWTTTTANDEEYSAATNIGFNFTYAGTVFTQFQASTNGFIRMGTGLTSATSADALNGTLRSVIAPLWDNLAVTATATDITYLMSGSAPNRVLTVEWKNVKWNNTATTANSFQVKLYETTNIIEFNYGTMSAPTSGSASIGINDNSTTSSTSTVGLYVSVNIAGSLGTQTLQKTQSLPFNTVNTAIDANMLIRFTPETGAALSGTYTVGGSSPNFATPSDAALALNQRGISGPVVLNFRSGTYDDIFHLTKVTGQSATNTITLQEESGTVTLSPTNGSYSTTAPSATAGDAMIRLDGAQYVTIKNFYLTENALNTTTTKKFDMGVFLGTFYQYTNNGGVVISGARFNTLRSLRIDLNAQTGAKTTGATGIRFGTPVSNVYDTVYTNSYNTIVDCKIDDCFRSGIRYFGFSASNPDRGNKITGDTGRTYVGNITNISASAADGDMRLIEFEDQASFTIEKTDVQNVSYAGTLNATSNLYGIVSNLAGGATDYLVGDFTMDNVRIYSLYNSSTALTTAFTVGLSLNRGFNGQVVTIKNCKVYDLFTNGNAATRCAGMVLNLGPATGTSYLNVYNNMIYDLRAPLGTTNPVVRGIDIQASSSGAIVSKMYNNTISLTNSVPPTIASHYSACIYISNFTYSSIDFQNNILSNTMSAGTSSTGRAVALYASSAANLLRLTPASDKNIYYVGTPGTSRNISYNATTAYNTIYDHIGNLSLSNSIGREKNSSYENPPFVNATTDVHLSTSTGTMAEGRGNVLAEVSTDIDGNSRSGSTPDIGADEGSFTAGDYAGPIIGGSVLALSNSSSATTYTVTGVTITDGSGVNTTAGTKPRMYYKKPFHASAFVGNTSADNGWKYVEANEASSPYSFTLDFSLLLGGSAAANDTIYYFVVAQDLAGTPNVGVFPSSSFVGTSVSSITTAPSANYTFYIANNLSGSVTVGTGGTYASLTGAGGLFDAINKSIVTGNITATIISDLTEAGTVGLNQWSESGVGNYTLTIQPDAATVRNISMAGSIFLIGADRVTFDGRFGGSGRYLRFYTSSAVVMMYIYADANNNTVKYCTFESAAGGTTPTINFNNATATGSDYNTIDNCLFRDRSDIASTYATAISTTNGNASASQYNDNITISNNEFMNFFLPAGSASAINIGEGNTNWTITGNSFYLTGTKTFTTTGQAWQAVFIATANGYFTVSNNYIGGSAVNAGGSAATISSAASISATAYGIRLSLASGITASTVSGNVFKNLSLTNNTNTSGSITLSGFLISDGFVNVTDNTFGDTTVTNSVVFTNGTINTTATAIVAGAYPIYFTGVKGSITNNTIAGLQIVNNISNTSTATNGTEFRGIFVAGVGAAQTVSGNKIGSYTVPNSISMISGTNVDSTNIYSLFRGIQASNLFGGTISGNTVINLTARTRSSSASNVTGGISISSGAFTSFNNVVANLESKGTSSGSAAPVVYGILDAGNSTHNIYGNRISGLLNSSVAANNPYVAGITVSSQTGIGSIYNNLISDLKNTATGSGPYIVGLMAYWGSWNAYNNMISVDNGANTNGVLVLGINDAVGLPWAYVYNTVRVGGTAASGALNSFAYYRNYPTAITMKNNIFANVRANSGATGKHYAVGNANLQTSNVGDGWTSTGVDYNNYYSATSSTTGLWNTTDCDFATFKSTSGADANSSNATVNFTSSTDLHLTGASLGDRNLSGVALGTYTTDYDGETRSTIKPYKGFDENTSNPLYMNLNLTAYIEAMYDGSNQVADTMKVYLANAALTIVDSATAKLSTAGTATFTFSKPTSNTTTGYFLKLTHRNGIETWSAATAAFGGANYSYNMTTAASQAYGSNLVLKSGKYCIYSGDVNQDGLVDLSDLLAIDNDNANFASGYLVTDVNGDDLTDLSDLLVADNNNAAFVSRVVPSGSLLKANRTRVETTKKELINN